MLRPLCLAVLALSVPAYGADLSSDAVTFKVRIENVSTGNTLKTSDGKTAPAPNSPGVWVIHTGKSPLFVTGKPEMGRGLEQQAEEGNPMRLAMWLEQQHGKNHVAHGVFNTPVGDTQPGPALPGKAYEFTVMASPGAKLSLTSMFAQSNDLFYAPSEDGIPLFDRNGKPIRGDITRSLQLWDAGTEVNEEPGSGPNQAPRQPTPNTGPAEGGTVRLVRDGFSYPAVTDVIRVTITPGM
jgi:hypothetical protein